MHVYVLHDRAKPTREYLLLDAALWATAGVFVGLLRWRRQEKRYKHAIETWGERD
jgi:hypothetical protein